MADDPRIMGLGTHVPMAAYEAQRDRFTALQAQNRKLVEALTKAGNRLDWCAGLIVADNARDKASEWAEEARAAIAEAEKGE